MKLLLLLALVGLAASAGVRISPQVRNSLQTLVYQYDTQVATGTEEASDQFSTVRMRFTVVMRPMPEAAVGMSQARWKIAFQTVNIRQRNNATEFLPKNLQPMQQFRDLENSDLWTSMEQLLKTPFMVTMDNLKFSIKDVHFDERDPFWSVNLKKGFLSLLDLNFQLPNPRSSEDQEAGRVNTEIDQMTTAGLCKTQYSSEKLQNHGTQRQITKISKATDFNNCKNPLDGRRGLAGVWIGLHHSEPLQQMQQKKRINTNNLAEYLLEQADSNKLMSLIKASSKTVYTLQPFASSWQGTERMIAIQKLELKDRIDTDIAIDVATQKEHPQGLRLTFPEEAKDVDVNVVKGEVLRLFDQLLKENNDLKVEVYEQILRFLRFHLFNEEQLRSIAEQLVGKPKKQQLLQIFIVDMCPQVGSHGSVQFLLKVVKQLLRETTPQEYVRQASINISHITAIFAKLSLQSKVQVKSLQLILDTIKADSFKAKLLTADRLPIFSSCWLSLGAMVNVYYSRQGGVEPYLFPVQDNQEENIRRVQNAPWEVRSEQARESEQFRSQFIAEIREALQKEGVMRTLALKVTKNCGLYELYNDVSRFIKSKEHKVQDRVEAAYSTAQMLRRHTLSLIFSEDTRSILDQEKYIRDHQEFIRHFDRVSRQIQADLIACFKNPREDPELRIACYRVLMQSPISQSTLNWLMQTVMSDPTQQVHAYCVQHMQQIAERPLPRYSRRVASTVRSVLSMIQSRQPVTATFSRVFHAKMWDQLHDMGFTMETDVIASDKSFTPRWTHIRLDHQSMGANLPLVEISVRTEGLQQVLEKILGPRGLLYNTDIMQLLRRSARSLYDSSITIDEEMLNIVPRILKEMPNMDLTVSIMGYDTVFVKNSRQFIDSVSRYDTAAIASSFNQLVSIFQPLVRFFTLSGSYQIPTPVGTMLEMNCLINMNFAPKLNVQKQLEETSGKIKGQVSAELPLKLQMFRRIGNNMHMLQHFHQFVTKVQVNKGMQYKLGFEFNREESNAWTITLLQWRPSAQKKLVKVTNKAFCIINELQFRDSNMVVSVLKELVKPKMVVQPKTLNYQPMINDILKAFGIQLRINAQFYSGENLFQAPCAVFMGPSRLEVVATPDSNIFSRRSIVKHQLKVTFPLEKLAVPQLELKVDEVSEDNTESSIKQIAELQFIPKNVVESNKFPFECRLNVIGDSQRFSVEGEVELPEDLRMTPRSVPLVASEWIAERQLIVNMQLQKNSGRVANIRVALSTNPQLVQILQNSRISQQQMLRLFPLLVQCLNETKESQTEAPLSANRLFTPSCVRQFKKFNQLSGMRVEFEWQTEAMPISGCRICRSALRQLKQMLLPYLTEKTPLEEESSTKKMEISACPSPVDSRVLHLNFTCPWMQSQWRSIQLPFTPFAWAAVDPVVTSISDFVKGGAAKCQLMHSHIRTFDNVVYSIPKSLFSRIAQNQCPVLLARDCSEKKEFQVLTHIKDGKKFITIQLDQGQSRPFVIEMSKTLNSAEEKCTVKMNNREVSQSEEPQQPVQLIDRTIRTSKGPMQILISRYQYADTLMYRIRSVQQQLEILVGGKQLRTVEIRVSPFYNNKICGLCGDYNSEKYREFKGPNFHKVATSALWMTQQYVLPISDACRVADESSLEENWQNRPFSVYDIVHKPAWSSFDMPTRRPSCSISQERVKTFKHADISLLSPAVRTILRQTPCSVKLAVANIQGNKVYVYMKPSQKKLIIKAGSFEQEMNIERPFDSRRSSDPLPHGMTLRLDDLSFGKECQIEKDAQKLSVAVVTGERVIIKVTNPDTSENSVCELTSDSQTQLRYDNAISFMQQFTNAKDDETCRTQLLRNVAQCHVSAEQVTPYIQAIDSSRPQVQFLNDELVDELSQSEIPVVLSVEKLGDQAHAYSVQMQMSQEAGQTVRHILVKRNRQLLLKVTKPQSGSAQAEFLKDGSQQQKSCDTSEEIDIDHDFKLVLSPQHVLLRHQNKLYEVKVQLSSSIPEVSIIRAYHHQSYSSTGACQINKRYDVMPYQSNPRAVLQQIVRNSVVANNEETPIFTSAEVEKINEFLGNADVIDF